jgi:hypothetical protein
LAGTDLDANTAGFGGTSAGTDSGEAGKERRQGLAPGASSGISICLATEEAGCVAGVAGSVEVVVEAAAGGTATGCRSVVVVAGAGVEGLADGSVVGGATRGSVVVVAGKLTAAGRVVVVTAA